MAELTAWDMKNLRINVERGAAWLDQNQPNWVSKVDISALDMAECDRCVIGQTYGDYWNKISEMCELAGDSEWPVWNGFDSPEYKDYTYSYGDLEQEWLYQIGLRLRERR